MRESDSTEQDTVEVQNFAVERKKSRRISQLKPSRLYFLCLIFLPGAAFAGFACLSNPCVNGVCIDDLNSTYSCYCIDGFTGVQCQTNWDECWSTPCRNGGTCIDGIAEYNCTCPDGFIGSDCEIDFDECDSNPCQNNGTCVDAANGFSCVCLPGYSGTYCEDDMAVCNLTEETRCSNGGHCIEGQGMSFTCKCGLGWAGKLCESPIDECNSSPCHNGGLCIDLHADYACACTFGYTGKNCESEIELCSNNPCINNALCMMENTIRTCYCVPDYHGEKCQFQYDECLLGPRCMNGGTCIDGVDNFTCSCPPMLTGVLCECLILDDGDLDCEYVSPTPPPSESTTDFLTTVTDYITEYYTSTQQDNKTTVFIPITYDTSDITNIDTSTSYVTSENTLQTIVPTNLWDQSTSTLFDNNLFTSTYEPPFISKSTPTLLNETSETSSFAETNKPYDLSTPFYTTKNEIEVSSTSSYTITLEPEGDTKISSTSSFYTIDIEKTSTEEQITSEIASTMLMTDLKTESPLITQTPTEFVYQNASTAYTTDITAGYTDRTTDKEFSFSTVIIPTDKESKDTTEYKSSTLGYDETATVTEVYSTISIDKNHTTIRSDEVTPTDFTYLTREITSYFTESTTTLETTETMLLTTYPFDDTTDITTTEINNCNGVLCLNGGSCISSSEGPKCVCKFDFDGPFCEQVLGIATAAFSGDSYLTHKLFDMSGIRIQLKARTLSTEGLILHANLGLDTYMCLYVVKGLLKFKFSCGYQTMLLSELEVPINNGYEIGIKAVLEYTDNRRHCNASLHINDTLAMSGGQIAAPSKYPRLKDSWLHLGGIPDGFGITNHAPADIDPFTGCMLGLRIDGKPRHIFKDASDGFEIKECSSLACLSNPCLNGGSCNDIGERWTCNCANGYLGKHCEKSVCSVNPCQFGGTCVQHPGSGFLCLCPLGKHGLYCEHNLEIAQPSFSSMVGGLSSYAVYQIPQNLISQGMEIRFRIQPNNMDQIALLAFLGQSGPHDLKSDHLAVTFVKGYIMLTWNLGNGPRRIFTSRPISSRSTKPHYIKIGRLGRAAWLAVDNMQNITGNAPGSLMNLNVLPYLYLGGHESANFSMLPHDLPLHGGFSGCIWDLWVGNIGSKNGGIAWVPIRGRAVGQCSVTQCHPMICHNGGACLHHAATYSCLCPESWFGPLCTSQHNPCDSTFSKCSSGSTCVPTVTGYQCDCPLGSSGTYCEKSVELSDVSLSGIRSYVKLKMMTLGDVHFSLEFEVRPLHPKGIIFYTETHDGSFVSLSLQGGLLEYRWAGHEWSGKYPGNQVVVIVRSGVVLSLGSWHMVRAGRYGRKLFLWVDGTMTTESLTSYQSFTSFNTSIFIGGVEDLSKLPIDVMSGHPMSYNGCVRKVIINSHHLPLNKNYINESRNADDCDGDVCGGDVCWNGGSCVISREQGRNIPKCACLQPYTGPNCLHAIPCKPGGCNKGQCVQNLCICPTGWGGHSCQNQIKVETPQFGGNSYMIIDESKFNTSPKQITHNKMRYKRNANYLYMNFTTANADGLLLWAEMNNKKYVSVGLEGGFLKVSWTMPKLLKKNITKRAHTEIEWPIEPFHDTEVIKLLQAGKLSNGEWHTLHFKFQPGNISVITDNKMVYEENGLNYEIKNVDIIMFIGGLPHNVSLNRHTKGMYSSNFVGCISEVSFGPEKHSITDFSNFEGENVEVCQLIS